MDRISDLPNEIICHIGSFLSAKEAACTKVLSKKWLNLITIIPDLVFDPSFETRVRLKYFVHGLLTRHASYRVKRFSLNLRSMDLEYSNLVNDCLRDMVKRGVMDLEVNVNVKEDDEYSLPDEVFTCKTIEKLKLGSSFVIDILPKNALLPTLKTLVLDSIRFYGYDGVCAFQTILSACPVIEELVIHGFNSEQWKWSHIVSSLTLKRLTMRREVWNVPDLDCSESNTISFDTPSLTYLEYSDYMPKEYLIVNLDALVEAKLTLHWKYFGINYNLANMVKGLRNVQTLHIGIIDVLELLFHRCSEEVSVFKNLFHLSVTNDQDFCWNGLRVLLAKSPNLKTLTIEYSLHYNSYDESVCECLLGYSFLSSCAIEVLKITYFKGDIGEMVQIKHVLENLPCLKLLEVHILPRREDRKLHVMKELLMLTKASSKCKVNVMFS